MGYNSAIMICNDAMGEIDKDPVGWWQKAKEALMTLYRKDGTFGFGSHANGFQAICNEHADVVTVVAIGGNQACVLGHGYRDDDPETLLRKLAEEHGYTLQKKPVLKKK